MPLRRMLPFILVNIVVSAAVVLIVLLWWDSRTPAPEVVTATPPAVAFETAGAVAATGDTGPATPLATGDAEESSEGDDSAEGPQVHIVQAGETLGIISQQYDVPVEDIAEANDIVNVNSISIGQALTIPIGGLPTETPAPTATMTPAPTGTTPPTTEVEPEGAGVEITEVIGVGNLTLEAVRITNGGSQPLALQGWQLEDEHGNTFAFIDVTLFGNSDAGAPSILIHTEAGQNGPSDLYWGLESAVWEAGETVTLRDQAGVVQATYEIEETS